ncbi:hypothetical protein L195_g030199 [Trifolium pratense]|uniref:Uncharacterized protein n=1 Tax=Trifolium pratense TaxID=57577 RepID=A0A2K3L6Z8_TRIPR|nr:hypothetical protein L195_g030199 [Trifolium pratense]
MVVSCGGLIILIALGYVNPSFEVICENNKAVVYFNYGQRHAPCHYSFYYTILFIPLQQEVWDPEEVHSEYVNGIEIRWRPYVGSRSKTESDGEEKRKRLSLLCILYQTGFTCIDMSLMHIPYRERAPDIMSSEQHNPVLFYKLGSALGPSAVAFRKATTRIRPQAVVSSPCIRSDAVTCYAESVCIRPETECGLCSKLHP